MTTNSGQVTKSNLTITAGLVVPKITALSISSGSEGDQLRITGTNLGATTSVTMSGLAATFTVLGTGTLSVQVPNGAMTNRFLVYTQGGSVSSGVFTVIGSGD